MNRLKTMVLLVTLSLILVWAGGAFGGKQGMTMAFIFAGGMNLFAYWFSDKIVLKMYGAREVAESEAPELYGVVRRLAQKAEIPMPKVYMIDADPLSGGGLLKLFSTHPPMEERVARLEAMSL